MNLHYIYKGSVFNWQKTYRVRQANWRMLCSEIILFIAIIMENTRQTVQREFRRSDFLILKIVVNVVCSML